MKNFVIKWILAIGIVGIGVNFARAEERPTQILSVNPVGIIFGMVNGEYERIFKDKSSFLLRGAYSGNKIGDWKWSAMGIGGGYRKYFTSQAMLKGGFWGFGVDFSNTSAEYLRIKASSFWIVPGGEIGYRWLLGGNENFSVSVNGGLRLHIGSLKILGKSIPMQGIAPGIGVNLGYAW